MHIRHLIYIAFLTSILGFSLRTSYTADIRKPLAIEESLYPSIKKKFGYEQVWKPAEKLGSLLPRLPMAEVASNEKKQRSIRYKYGYRETWTSMVVKIKGVLVLLDSEEKFRKTFAPIETKEEAMSYVSFLTNTEARYKITVPADYRVYSDSFPSAYSRKNKKGFEVLLHDRKFSGCGPHPFFYKRFQVSTSGVITMIEDVRMYENPEDDRLCVD